MTFAATVFLDVLYGLIIGIAFSALVVFHRTQFSKAFTIGWLVDTEVFKPNNVYTSVSLFTLEKMSLKVLLLTVFLHQCIEDSKVKVIRYIGGLFYAGADLFKASVIEAAGFDPHPIIFGKNKLDSVVKEADKIISQKSHFSDSLESEDIRLPSLPSGGELF